MTPDAAHHVFILAIMTLATVLIVAAMRTFARSRQARAVSPLASSATLEALRGDIGEMKARLTAVETMLREVG